MTVWAIKHRTFVNNFAYETAEINIEVKHLLKNIIFFGIRQNLLNNLSHNCLFIHIMSPILEKY